MKNWGRAFRPRSRPRPRNLKKTEDENDDEDDVILPFFTPALNAASGFEGFHGLKRAEARAPKIHRRKNLSLPISIS